MARLFLSLAGVAGFLGVAAGAFGAHALRNRLAEDLMAAFQTGVQYHLVHALGLGIIAVALAHGSGGLLELAGWLFTAGILLFSGSLYALALTGVRILGAITPLGGLCFLGGWLCLLIAGWRGSAGMG